MSQEVLVEVLDQVMVITLNRPQAKNAVNLGMAKGLAEAMHTLDSRDDIQVAILTGADNTFCAGMDLKAFVSGELPIIPGKGFGGFVESPPKKPLIAAVEGFALAGGFEIALACDLIVASEDVKFGIPEVRRGLVAAAGGLLRLPRQIPRKVATEMVLTGAHISSQRAYEIGLINRVVENGKALDAAKQIAKTIAANGPLALIKSKEVISKSQDWTTDEMFHKQSAITDLVFSSEDAIEGATAFAEKRQPNWKGR